MDVVLVGYSVDRTYAALKFCDALFENVPIGRRLLIANNPAILGTHPPNVWELVSGSNSLGEFSAWNEGLAILRADASERKGVVFLNDTTGAHRHLSRFMRHAFRKTLASLRPNSLVGFSDGSPPPGGPHSILGMPLQLWVSTFCFAISSDVLQRLDWRLAREEEVDRCVAGGEDAAAFFADSISSDMREYLQWWLFGGGWYRSEPLRAENHEYFLLKARCICAELLFSARLRAMEVEFHDPLRRHPVAAGLDAASGRIYRVLSDLHRPSAR